MTQADVEDCTLSVGPPRSASLTSGKTASATDMSPAKSTGNELHSSRADSAASGALATASRKETAQQQSAGSAKPPDAQPDFASTAITALEKHHKADSFRTWFGVHLSATDPARLGLQLLVLTLLQRALTSGGHHNFSLDGRQHRATEGNVQECLQQMVELMWQVWGVVRSAPKLQLQALTKWDDSGLTLALLATYLNVVVRAMMPSIYSTFDGPRSKLVAIRRLSMFLVTLLTAVRAPYSRLHSILTWNKSASYSRRVVLWLLLPLNSMLLARLPLGYHLPVASLEWAMAAGASCIVDWRLLRKGPCPLELMLSCFFCFALPSLILWWRELQARHSLESALDTKSPAIYAALRSLQPHEPEAVTMTGRNLNDKVDETSQGMLEKVKAAVKKERGEQLAKAAAKKMAAAARAATAATAAAAAAGGASSSVGGGMGSEGGSFLSRSGHRGAAFSEDIPSAGASSSQQLLTLQPATAVIPFYGNRWTARSGDLAACSASEMAVASSEMSPAAVDSGVAAAERGVRRAACTLATATANMHRDLYDSGGTSQDLQNTNAGSASAPAGAAAIPPSTAAASAASAREVVSAWQRLSRAQNLSPMAQTFPPITSLPVVAAADSNPGNSGGSSTHTGGNSGGGGGGGGSRELPSANTVFAGLRGGDSTAHGRSGSPGGGSRSSSLPGGSLQAAHSHALSVGRGLAGPPAATPLYNPSSNTSLHVLTFKVQRAPGETFDESSAAVLAAARSAVSQTVAGAGGQLLSAHCLTMRGCIRLLMALQQQRSRSPTAELPLLPVGSEDSTSSGAFVTPDVEDESGRGDGCHGGTHIAAAVQAALQQLSVSYAEGGELGMHPFVDCYLSSPAIVCSAVSANTILPLHGFDALPSLADVGAGSGDGAAPGLALPGGNSDQQHDDRDDNASFADQHGGRRRAGTPLRDGGGVLIGGGGRGAGFCGVHALTLVLGPGCRVEASVRIRVVVSQAEQVLLDLTVGPANSHTQPCGAVLVSLPLPVSAPGLAFVHVFRLDDDRKAATDQADSLVQNSTDVISSSAMNCAAVGHDTVGEDAAGERAPATVNEVDRAEADTVALRAGRNSDEQTPPASPAAQASEVLMCSLPFLCLPEPLAVELAMLYSTMRSQQVFVQAQAAAEVAAAAEREEQLRAEEERVEEAARQQAVHDDRRLDRQQQQQQAVGQPGGALVQQPLEVDVALAGQSPSQSGPPTPTADEPLRLHGGDGGVGFGWDRLGGAGRHNRPSATAPAVAVPASAFDPVYCTVYHLHMAPLLWDLQRAMFETTTILDPAYMNARNPPHDSHELPPQSSLPMNPQEIELLLTYIAQNGMQVCLDVLLARLQPVLQPPSPSQETSWVAQAQQQLAVAAAAEPHPAPSMPADGNQNGELAPSADQQWHAEQHMMSAREQWTSVSFDRSTFTFDRTTSASATMGAQDSAVFAPQATSPRANSLAAPSHNSASDVGTSSFPNSAATSMSQTGGTFSIAGSLAGTSLLHNVSVPTSAANSQSQATNSNSQMISGSGGGESGSGDSGSGSGSGGSGNSLGTVKGGSARAWAGHLRSPAKRSHLGVNQGWPGAQSSPQNKFAALAAEQEQVSVQEVVMSGQLDQSQEQQQKVKDASGNDGVGSSHSMSQQLSQPQAEEQLSPQNSKPSQRKGKKGQSQRPQQQANVGKAAKQLDKEDAGPHGGERPQNVIEAWQKALQESWYGFPDKALEDQYCACKEGWASVADCCGLIVLLLVMARKGITQPHEGNTLSHVLSTAWGGALMSVVLLLLYVLAPETMVQNRCYTKPVIAALLPLAGWKGYDVIGRRGDAQMVPLPWKNWLEAWAIFAVMPAIFPVSPHYQAVTTFVFCTRPYILACLHRDSTCSATNLGIVALVGAVCIFTATGVSVAIDITARRGFLKWMGAHPERHAQLADKMQKTGAAQKKVHQQREPNWLAKLFNQKHDRLSSEEQTDWDRQGSSG